MNIVLGVCTYRRPDGLAKLLNSLPALEGDNRLTVVVADNDAAGEGKAVCDALAADYPFDVHAFIQATSGISAIRNAVALKALSFDPDVVAFLDDDEWPEPQWLAELLRILKEHDADVVGGPTLPEFPESADQALRNNPYYGADLQLADGSACQLQAGGNFLIKACVLARYSPAFFHENFAHTGSEDLAFFTQLGRDGYRMFWAANATVYEPVPDARLAPGWLKQRVINIHNSRVRVMQHLQPSIGSACVRLVKTAALTAAVAAYSALALLVPSRKGEAQLLRWKLIGKLTAHAGRDIKRGETY